MTTEEIIADKIKETIYDISIGFSDVFNGKKVSVYIYYSNRNMVVSIDGLPGKDFNIDRDIDSIIDYIINSTKN